MTDYSRDRQLDMLRGIAVMGMFFYSLVGVLSQNLPPLLDHNVAGKLLLGDFVLSLFLFSSGMSLAILRSRYESVWKFSLWKNIAKRLGMLLLASAFITPFSAGYFWGMDEVMLNAALTVPTVLLAGLGMVPNVAVMVMIALLYYLLPLAGVTLISPTLYLGGYGGALFFLPVILAGAMVSKSWRARVPRQIIVWGVVTMTLWATVSTPNKLLLNPTFMALSCFVSLLTLYVLGRFSLRSSWIEYCGSHSLRMWCLMFVLFIPARLYASTRLHGPRLSLSAWEAVAIALLWIALSYLASRGWDKLGTLGKK